MTGRLAEWRASVRQHRYRKAFRIPPPTWDEEQQRWLADTLGAAPEVVLPAESTAVDQEALAVSATNLWRALRKLQDADDTAPAVRHAQHYLRKVRQTLADGGLVIYDHDGELFHPGLSLEVLARETSAGAEKETVAETVRPTVYLGDERIQLGQVIVVGPPFEQTQEGDGGA
ncbi:hypothetical protein [Fodinicola acaciae]|uniref:hypothetical protein n=1 Tax=Fodinicola acaciae TaxID=2681555 RepID=UPI0013D36DC1|nr:hypothetical protein [Fodinicola acaciae]